MKPFTTGFTLAIAIASIALNIAQYKGILSAPRMVVLEQTDAEKLASIYGGLDDNR